VLMQGLEDFEMTQERFNDMLATALNEMASNPALNPSLAPGEFNQAVERGLIGSARPNELMPRQALGAIGNRIYDAILREFNGQR